MRAPLFTMRQGHRDTMNVLNRTIVVAAIAGFAIAAQTTTSGAIQWPWKRDRGSEEIILPPPAEGCLPARSSSCHRPP